MVLAPHEHSIQTQVFEISFPDRERATEVQNRVSQLFNNRLSPLMARIFDKHVPEDLLVRLDTLELDLGSIAYAGFEEELTERLTLELEKALAGRFAGLTDRAGNPPVMEVLALNGSFADLLEHFLVHGTMPWWVNESLAADPEKILLQLLSKDPEAVKQLLLKTAESPHVRRRLVYRFGEATLRALITLLEPREAAFIFEYHQHIVRTHHKKPVVKNESSGFEKEVMVFILSAILSDRGSHFEKKMFVKSTLRQMASHYNTSYEGLLLLFSSTVDKITEDVKSNDYFPVLIRELFSEHVQALDAEYLPETRPAEKLRAIHSHVELLRHYLLFGSLPPWAEPCEKEELLRFFSEVIMATPALAAELLSSAARQEQARARVFHLADEALFNRIVILAEKEEAGFILDFTRALIQFHSKIKSHTEDAVTEQSLRESVFTHLYTDRSPVFSKRVFLENTIRGMASLYGRPFRVLLPAFAQFIGEEFNSRSNYTALFYLVTSLLKETPAAPQIVNETSDHEATDQLEPALSSHAQKNILPRDLLAHFLLHGYLPWWSDSSGISPEALLNELLRDAPDQAQQLIWLAGTQNQAKQRLLSGFSPDILLKLFQTIDGNSLALKLFEALADFIKADPAVSSLNTGDTSRQLLELLWEDYEGDNQRSFNTLRYIEKTLSYLAFKTGLPVDALINALKRYSDLQPMALRQELQRFINTASASFQAEQAISGMMQTVTTPVSLADLIKDYIQAGQPLHKELLLSTAFDLLHYFLTWNKLPEHLHHLQGAGLESLLKQLLILLGRDNPVALKNLMDRGEFSSKTKMQLHQALGVESSMVEKNTRSLLAPYFERDLLHYLEEQPLAGISLPQGKPGEWLEKVLRHDSSAAGRTRILRLLTGSGRFNHLLVWQFTDHQFYAALNALAPANMGKMTDAVKTLQDFLRLAVSDTLEQEKNDALLKEFSLYYFSRPGFAASFHEFLRTFIQFLAARRPISLQALSSRIEARVQTSPSTPPPIPGSLEGIRELLHQQLKKEYNATSLLSEIKQSDLSHINQLSGEWLTSLETRLQQELQHGQEAELEEQLFPLLPDSSEKTYIQNAGLVLLHPFISTLFNRAGLTENNQFVTAEARHRGTYLLQYLAFENSAYAEHAMALNKLLCGIPMQLPLLPGITLHEKEMEMAQGLLQSVIQQWEKMKNTSVPGFQASFLQRSAVLSQSEESWNMKVEQRGYDVLLQTLPWSFGMIKTPWMDKFLYVEWT
jgi:hypothetical protein